MHQAATGYFRRADRFPRGRRAGDQPVGEDIVRLSMSAWLRRGQELRHRVLYFGLGVSGACYPAGARRGAGLGLPSRSARETSRIPESARDQDQVGPVAGTSGRLSGTLSPPSCRTDLLNCTRVFCKADFQSLCKITLVDMKVLCVTSREEQAIQRID